MVGRQALQANCFIFLLLVVSALASASQVEQITRLCDTKNLAVVQLQCVHCSWEYVAVNDSAVDARGPRMEMCQIQSDPYRPGVVAVKAFQFRIVPAAAVAALERVQLPMDRLTERRKGEHRDRWVMIESVKMPCVFAHTPPLNSRNPLVRLWHAPAPPAPDVPLVTLPTAWADDDSAPHPVGFKRPSGILPGLRALNSVMRIPSFAPLLAVWNSTTAPSAGAGDNTSSSTPSGAPVSFLQLVARSRLRGRADANDLMMSSTVAPIPDHVPDNEDVLGNINHRITSSGGELTNAADDDDSPKPGAKTGNAKAGSTPALREGSSPLFRADLVRQDMAQGPPSDSPTGPAPPLDITATPTAPAPVDGPVATVDGSTLTSSGVDGGSEAEAEGGSGSWPPTSGGDSTNKQYFKFLDPTSQDWEAVAIAESLHKIGSPEEIARQNLTQAIAEAALHEALKCPPTGCPPESNPQPSAQQLAGSSAGNASQPTAPAAAASGGPSSGAPLASPDAGPAAGPLPDPPRIPPSLVVVPDVDALPTETVLSPAEGVVPTTLVPPPPANVPPPDSLAAPQINLTAVMASVSTTATSTQNSSNTTSSSSSSSSSSSDTSVSGSPLQGVTPPQMRMPIQSFSARYPNIAQPSFVFPPPGLNLHPAETPVVPPNVTKLPPPPPPKPRPHNATASIADCHSEECRRLEFVLGATWVMRPGLADRSLVSFESFHMPGYYLFHEFASGNIAVGRGTSREFAQRATFTVTVLDREMLASGPSACY